MPRLKEQLCKSWPPRLLGNLEVGGEKIVRRKQGQLEAAGYYPGSM